MTVVSQIQRLSVPTPFPVGPVNVYSIKGPAGFYLIDAGIVSPECRALIKEWLPRPVAGILLTHAHMDHLGLAREIALEENCPVYVHPEEFQRLRDMEHQIAMMRRLMALGEVPKDILMSALVPYEKLRNGLVQPLIGVECRDLVPGQEFATDLGNLRVLHTPGHAQGHCCFYCGDQRVLFSGDHILRNVLPNPLLEEDRQGNRCRSYENYLKSVGKVSSLAVDQVYPGHGKPFSGLAEVVQNFQAYHSSRAQRVLDRVSAQAQTPWEFTSQLYPDAEGTGVFYALSKVWGHLDVLESAGRISGGKVTGGYSILQRL